MRLIARKGKFVCALLTVILSGSLFTRVVFADDEPKTVPAGDEQPRKLGTAKTESGWQSDSAASETSAPQEPKRRALPAPLDPLFPGSEYLGPTPLIGVPDTDPEYPLEKALWSAFPALKAQRIKVYGWVNAGFDFSTSNKSNIPESYAIVPNKLELDQAVVRIERLPDTVQRDHVDWGFRLTPMYGIDYRWTTAQGWLSGHRHHLAILDLGSYRTGPRLWRTLNPVERFFGVPMCGLFASFLFAIVTRPGEPAAAH